jgi:hypothetical protein
MGYDNTSGRFQTSWVDNMGTMIMYMTGQWHAQDSRGLLAR